MSEPPPEPPPRLLAALECAAGGIAVIASHFPVATSDADPAEPAGTLACSCGEAGCRTPARHPIGTAAAGDATLDGDELRRWWWETPEANVATPAGITFDLVEVRHPAPTGRIVRWLAVQGIACGPVICAGPTRHQFLVAVGEEGWRFTMTEHGGVIRLGGGGGLVLLPPSLQADGTTCQWLGPHCVSPRADGERIYDALVRLPGRGQLASAVA